MSIDLVNLTTVIISGVLTGLVYGLMALGLSVIFGVARVVNFAHGEITTMAMYATVVAFAVLHLDPFVALLPVLSFLFSATFCRRPSSIDSSLARNIANSCCSLRSP